MLASIIRLFRRPPEPVKKPRYVIVYGYKDKLGDLVEEYYGYFHSPEEARDIWKEFTIGSENQYTHVRLCLVCEDWS